MADPPPTEHDRNMIESARREAAELVGQSAQTLPPSDAAPGFKIISEVGRGGMGVVYKAVQLSTNRIVALKVMLAGPFASSSTRLRFQREVELAARFQHPGIVRVLEGGEAPTNQLYYAMDFVDGIQLNRWLTSTRPDVPTMLRLFERLGRAIEYAHRHEVIHRDLKPANVLVDAEGYPHILDFGLSKSTDPDTEQQNLTICTLDAGQVMGTLPYMSPEQAAGAPADIDARTDVYALGVMLFEAISGSLPVNASGNPSDVMQRIRDDPPLSPSSLAARADRDLRTIILKTLEKDRRRRYQSARELADDIDRYLGNEPISARVPSGLYLARKKLSRHRTKIAVAAACVVFVPVMWVAHNWWESRLRNHQRIHTDNIARIDVMDADLCLQLGLEGALEQARHTANRHPHLPEALLVCARAEHGAGRTYSAVSKLEIASADKSAGWAARALLAEIFRDQEQADLAAKLEARADDVPTDTPHTWYLRSFATLNLSRAVECINRAVELDPTYTLAWMRLVHLHYANARFDRALSGADKLVELRPDDVRTARLRGYVLLRLGRFHDAIEQFTDAINLAPDHYYGYRFRANAYRGAKDYGLAVADLTTEWDLQHRRQGTASSWLLFQQVTPLWILGRLDEAAATSKAAHEKMLTPTYGDARHVLILRELGRDDEAQSVLERVVAANPDAWLRKILQCLDGRITPASLVDAADSAEHRCEAYYYAAEASLRKGDTPAAVNWFRRCVDTQMWLDPNTWPPEPMNEYELARWRLESLVAHPRPGSEVKADLTDRSGAAIP